MVSEVIRHISLAHRKGKPVLHSWLERDDVRVEHSVMCLTFIGNRWCISPMTTATRAVGLRRSDPTLRSERCFDRLIDASDNFSKRSITEAQGLQDCCHDEYRITLRMPILEPDPAICGKRD